MPPVRHEELTRAINRFPPRSTLFPVLVAALGCGPSLPGAQSPERQSETEYDLARDYFSKGQPRIALDHAKKSVELDDSNSKANYFTSELYLFFCSGTDGLLSVDCKLALAETYARRALSADDSFRDARNLLGQVLINEAKYKEAISVFQPLVKDPSYSSPFLAWGNLGWAQVLSGAVDEGITSLKNAVTQPKFCVGLYRLGVAYQKKADWAEAERNFTQAVHVDSPDCQVLQDAWQARADVRLRQGKKDDACQDLSRCASISSETATGKLCLQTALKFACPTEGARVTP